MFEFIIGDIVNIGEDYIVLQNGGIGYKIFTSSNSMGDVELGDKDQMIYTQLNVRDDGLFLFGFTSEEEMEMYNLLLRVSKIGPKIGIGVLSSLTPNQIKFAIINRDIELLCTAPGVGKKTAERIILELKDRIDTDIKLELDDHRGVESKNQNEAVEALVTLGYKRYEIQRIIKDMDLSGMNVETIIREVLNRLSKK